ncbi:hypothetical protein DFH07DRAFT_772820 [Mycena maculata]|uniref:DUF6532 domain-containing protein n=1 Tax=Mycena maculata TaxID=230809 RepID=A0AAD7NET4_9AGAR|nr:hypothetical protein DFH07DRAFT_772820 [Mycena maculata]
MTRVPDTDESDSDQDRRPAPSTGKSTRNRKASEKQSENDKENYEALQERVRQAEKVLLKAKKKAGKIAAPLSDNARRDDGYESEEPLEEPSGVGFATSITAMGRLSVPPKRTQAPVVRKTTKAVASDTPKISSTVFKHLPEPTRLTSTPPSPSGSGDDSMNFDSGTVDLIPPRSTPHGVPRDSASPSPLDSARARAEAEAGDKRRRRESSPPPPPPAKRSKHKAKKPQFREGFVVVAGAKPKASDYAPTEEALLLRACAEYSVRIIAVEAFPDTTFQYKLADECFNNACSSAKEHYKATDRMLKLIIKRGSHIRGKEVESFRPLSASHYGFKLGSSKAVVAANKLRAERLLQKAAFHYKDTETRNAENAIIPAARHQMMFKDKKSLAATFPSYFNPISAAYLALDFSILQSLTQEWSTGTHVPAAFTEKEMSQAYRTHLADINDKWIKANPTVTENLRRKWYKRASQHFVPAELEKNTHIDEEDQDALRLELAGRTGETDSENEGQDDAMV